MEENAAAVLPEERFVFQLYVSGMSPRSLDAIENLEKLCATHLKDGFDLEIIDIYKNPERAIAQSIVFSPSLIKLSPSPKKILIGTLKDSAKVIKALGILK